MPTSTETQSGFSVGKWELYYLRGRYKSHRNKVAAAQPAIDSKPPAPRPHVRYKRKKGLDEKQRQTCIMIENLRILNKTCEIMNDSDYNYFHRPPPSRPSEEKNERQEQNTSVGKKRVLKPSNSKIISATTTGQHQHRKSGARATVPGMGDFHEEQLYQRQSQPITLIMKKNTHVILRWFLRRFGEYVPWWAELTY